MRSRNRYKSHSMGKTFSTLANGSVTQLGTYPSNRVYEAILDQTTHGYKRLVGRGALPINPLTYSCQSILCPVSNISIPGAVGSPPAAVITGVLTSWMNSAGVFGTPAVAPAPSYNVANMVAAAKSKCLARFDRPNYSFGEPIAELAHLVQTVKDPFTTVHKLLNRFHKERLKKSRTYVAGSKDLANLWAGYAFGIGPLVGSAVDAVEAYRQRNAISFRYESCYASDQLHTGKMFRESGSLSYSGWVSTRKSEREVSVVCKAGIYYSVMDNGTRRALVGLRARDLPGVAWELVPLSFMVDRVINVKRFINASSSLLSNNVKIIGAYTTTRTTDKIRYCHTDIRQGSNPSRKWSPSDSKWAEHTTFTLSRSKWAPSVADVVPRFENRLFSDVHSTLDLISIVLGKLKIKVDRSHWSHAYGYRQHN